jgi:glucose-1-phosphate thymidylyltransferase
MKGILLAGGTGSRLYPLTKVTNKHLLPVYNKPMIYYPLLTLKEAGITEVLVVSGRGHCGHFLELLGSGSHFDMKITYEVQEEAGGIAQALGLAESFAGDDKVMVVLGDNIIEDNLASAVKDFEKQESGSKIFLKEVENPESYGIAKLEAERIVSLVEKPSAPASNLAVIGCYMYDSSVFDVVKTLKPSGRNELEITDVNNFYLSRGDLTFGVLSGFWGDGGESFDSLMEASRLVASSRLANISSKLD